MLIFNHPAWIRVLEKTYKYNFEKFVVSSEEVYFYKKNNTKFTYYSHLPFSDEVHISDLNKFKEIVDGIINNNENVNMEIRANVEHEKFVKLQVGYKHKLNLDTNLDEIFSSFKKTQVQQPISKSIREGLLFNISNKKIDILQFYDLHLITRRRLGAPIQPQKFFLNFFDEIIKTNLGFIVNIYFQGKVISSGVFAGFVSDITYKFSASHPRYLNLRPNNLMLWTAIQEAKLRGFKFFDFGRTDLNAEGLRKFKQGWGTVEEPLIYSYYPKTPNLSKFNSFKDKVIKPIIKYSPKFICRLSGELFYKYFG